MKTDLLKVLHLLESLNRKVNGQIISKKGFEEAQRAVMVIERLNKEFFCIGRLQQEENHEANIKILVHLLWITSNYAENLDLIHSLVGRVIGNYREKAEKK